jgi:hypothetical protein
MISVRIETKKCFAGHPNGNKEANGEEKIEINGNVRGQAVGDRRAADKGRLEQRQGKI